MSVERSGYRRVARDLAAQIADGRLRPGTALRSERNLAYDYDVSTLTVRRALDVLDRDGLIEREAGRRARVRRTPPAELVALPAGAMLTVRRPTAGERHELRLAGGELVVEVDAGGEATLYGSDQVVIHRPAREG